MSVRPLLRKDYLVSRWKNGNGTTEQIAISPESAELSRGDFDWRLSSATIDRDGEFSLFPGYDRILLTLPPSEIRLIHSPDERRVPLEPLTPYRFSGDRVTRVELVGPGPVKDLGLLLRHGTVTGEMLTLTPDGARIARGDWNLLFAATPSFRFEIAGESGELAAGDSAQSPIGKIAVREGLGVLVEIRRL